MAPITDVGLAALSDEVRIIVRTSAARQASMTFWVPTTLVWVASNGLYSPDSTCLSAAQWKTRSMPSIARWSRSRSRMSPIRKRRSRPPGMPLALVELLGLVAAEDAHDARLELQQPLDEAGADRARTAGHEHPPIRQLLERVDRSGLLDRSWQGPVSSAGRMRPSPRVAYPVAPERHRPSTPRLDSPSVGPSQPHDQPASAGDQGEDRRGERRADRRRDVLDGDQRPDRPPPATAMTRPRARPARPPRASPSSSVVPSGRARPSASPAARGRGGQGPSRSRRSRRAPTPGTRRPPSGAGPSRDRAGRARSGRRRSRRSG